MWEYNALERDDNFYYSFRLRDRTFAQRYLDNFPESGENDRKSDWWDDTMGKSG